MRRSSLLAVVVVLVSVGLGGTVLSGQTPGAGPQPGNTVLVAEYQCSAGDLARVDQLLKEVSAPVLDKYVAEGKLLSWGVLGAYIGGPANRTVYVWAKDPVALVQARLQYLPEIMAKPGWAEVTRLCPTQTVSLRSLLLVSAPPK